MNWIVEKKRFEFEWYLPYRWDHLRNVSLHSDCNHWSYEWAESEWRRWNEGRDFHQTNWILSKFLRKKYIDGEMNIRIGGIGIIGLMNNQGCLNSCIQWIIRQCFKIVIRLMNMFQWKIFDQCWFMIDRCCREIGFIQIDCMNLFYMTNNVTSMMSSITT